jgi:hypothetical protein
MHKNRCNPDGSCAGNCSEGRDCVGSRTATCLALGLPFLITCEGGRRVSDDDSVRLPADRCSVCAGHCSTPEACHLPAERNTAPTFRIPAWAFAAAVAGAAAAAWVIARFPV